MSEVPPTVAWLDAALPDIVVSLASPTEGVPGDRPDLLGDLAAAVQLVAELLARLHTLDVTDLRRVGEGQPTGLVDGWEKLAHQIDQRPELDTSALPPPYDRYDHAELKRLWREGRPVAEEPVVCHGRPELGTLAFENGKLIGLGLRVGAETPLLGPLVADRHLDLAVIHRSITDHLGPEAVFAFYDAYPDPPDLVRLDHYVLASHLL